MVDGQVTGGDLAVRAGQLGLEAQAVFDLVQAGFIRRAAGVASESVFVQVTKPQPGVPKPAAPAVPACKHSLATARMYLMGIAVYTFSLAEHPIRQYPVEVTDRAPMEGVFDVLSAALHEATSASAMEQVEVSFRGFLPTEDNVAS